MLVRGQVEGEVEVEIEVRVYHTYQPSYVPASPSCRNKFLSLHYSCKQKIFDRNVNGNFYTSHACPPGGVACGRRQTYLGMLSLIEGPAYLGAYSTAGA